MVWIGSFLAIFGLTLTGGFAWRLVHSLRLIPEPSEEISSLPRGVRLGIVIPARDEKRSIALTLERVTAAVARYPGSEHATIVVVDDRSQDATGELARAAASRYPGHNIRVLTGRAPPAGWTGKAWACQQGVKALTATSYSHLLFLDADIRLSPTALQRAFVALSEQGLGLLSLYPQLICQSIAERAVQPLMMANLLIGFPPERVADPASPQAIGIGGFLLFDAAAYRDAGTHFAVAGAADEAMRLAQLTKATGHRINLINGTQFAHIRMYATLRGLWEGWVKNLYPVSGRPLRMIFIALVMITVHVLGWFLIAAAPIIATTPVGMAAVAAPASAQLIVHWRMFRKLRRIMAIGDAQWFLAPVGGVLIAAMIGASTFQGTLGKGNRWRGDRIPETQKKPR